MGFDFYIFIFYIHILSTLVHLKFNFKDREIKLGILVCHTYISTSAFLTPALGTPLPPSVTQSLTVFWVGK